jgi:hypothetical protein
MVGFVVDVNVAVVIDIKVIVVDEDRPVVPFAADEAVVRSLTATAGSSEEASRAFEVLGCPLLDPCLGETWGQSRC